MERVENPGARAQDGFVQTAGFVEPAAVVQAGRFAKFGFALVQPNPAAAL
jgi:hypothetical protein